MVRAATLTGLGIIVTAMLIGCSNSGPQLQYLDIGSDESLRPMVFGVSVENVGDATATVDNCSVELLATHIFPARGSESRLPPKFEHSWKLWETEDGLTIKPRDSRLVPISLAWELPDASVNLVAVCQAKFLLSYNAQPDVTSDAVMFVITSNNDALAQLLDEPMGDITNSGEILQQLRSFRGEKTTSAEKIIEKLAESIGS